MRYALVLVIVGIVVSAAAADSAVVSHERLTVSRTFVDRSSCSFPVVTTSTANIDDALFFDSAGNLVRVLETVNHAVTTFGANGKTLEGIGTGGFELVFNADGTQTVSTFGINLRVTIPGEGAVILDTGHAIFLFDPHIHVLFQAGPAGYDLSAFCAALAP